MKAEIITIGDELLIGQTIDTNSAWMGAELSKIGFDIHRRTSVHDKRKEIIDILTEAEKRSQVVLVTGGLGPTSDDITKHTLCEFFSTRLISDKTVLEMIQEMMNRRNIPMNENNRRQAEVPESCRILFNERGTAPGMWFEKNDTIFISMPGVPYEMKNIMEIHVLPELKKRFTEQVIIHKNIMTYGTPEAKLAEILHEFEENLPAEIKLAYLPASGIIKLRLTATGNDYKNLAGSIDRSVEKLYGIIPESIYGEDEETLEMVIAKILINNNKTMCTAESCTGGMISEMIISNPGSSQYFKGSVIAYDNSVKVKLLGVGEEVIQNNGAVSEIVVRQMAENARRIFNSDFSVATSGIAGPDGGTKEKPVGTVWIAVSSEKITTAVKYTFGNERRNNIHRFSLSAINLLRMHLISNLTFLR